MKRPNIVLLARVCLLALIAFATNSLEMFQRNSDGHAVNTGCKRDLHGPVADLRQATKRESDLLCLRYVK
jgi:hypothetical protein